MQNNKSGLISQIKSKYRIALVVIALMSTSSTGILLWHIEKQTDDAELINMSGRQRMLSQKIALHAQGLMLVEKQAQLTYHTEQLSRAIELFDQSHRTLSGRDDVSDKLRMAYFGSDYPLDHQIRDYVASAKSLIYGDPDNTRLPQSELFFSDFPQSLLFQLNQIVSIYEAEAEHKLSTLIRIELILWAITLLLLFVEAKTIFRPMIRVIDRAQGQLHGQQTLLEQEKLKAQQANKIKTQLLNNVSHELRTPLNGVLGMLQLIKERKIDTGVKKLAEKAEQSANDLLNLVESIMDFSELDSGLKVLRKQSVSLYELLHRIDRQYQQHCKKKGLAWQLSMAEDLPLFVVTDNKQLNQLIDALLSNACKFTNHGMVELKVGYQNSQLVIEVVDTGIGIDVEMQQAIFEGFNQQNTDYSRKYGGTGIGLSIVEHQIKLFEAKLELDSQSGKGSHFVLTIPMVSESWPTDIKMDAIERRVQELSGVNVQLAINNVALKRFTEQMLSAWQIKHRTWVQAELAEQQDTLILLDDELAGETGTGLQQLFADEDVGNSHRARLVSLFGNVQHWQAKYDTLLNTHLDSFPSCYTLFYALSWQSSHFAPSELTWPDKSVLVVEDNQVNQQVLLGMLARYQIKVEVADNGQQALNALQKRTFDLVFMDVQMPVMDGLTATQQLREDSRFVDLPIVAITAHAFSSDEQACYKAGMNGFLTKPIDINQLKHILRRYFEV